MTAPMPRFRETIEDNLQGRGHTNVLAQRIAQNAVAKENLSRPREQHANKQQFDRVLRSRQTIGVTSKNQNGSNAPLPLDDQKLKKDTLRTNNDTTIKNMVIEGLNPPIQKRNDGSHKFSIIRARQQQRRFSPFQNRQSSQSPTSRNQLVSLNQRQTLISKQTNIAQPAAEEPLKTAINQFKIKSILKTPSRQQNELEKPQTNRNSEQKHTQSSKETELFRQSIESQKLLKIMSKYMRETVDHNNMYFETDIESILSKNDDIRCQFLIEKGTSQTVSQTLQNDRKYDAFVPLGIVLYSFDSSNFKSQRVLIHHLSTANSEQFIAFLKLLETSIFKHFDVQPDEVFMKLKHRREQSEYAPIPKRLLDELKVAGWKWKMVTNELDARYTVLWMKRQPEVHGPSSNKCVEPFKFIFCGLISDDPDLVFLNKRESNPESFLCSDLMSYFGRMYEQHVKTGGKTPESNTVRSSIMIKSQTESFHLDSNRQQEVRKQDVSDSAHKNFKKDAKPDSNDPSHSSESLLLKTVNNSESQPATNRHDSAAHKTPIRPSPVEDEILFEYTTKLVLENSRTLVTEIERIFDSKLRDKHLKKIHFQTRKNTVSLLNTFRLALRLPSIARRFELVRDENLSFIRLNFFSKVTSSLLGHPVYIVNSLDPNFKLLVQKIDLEANEATIQQTLKKVISNLGDNTAAVTEDCETNGHIWVPEFKRCSIFDYIGSEHGKEHFCKFEVQLSLIPATDVILPMPSTTDIKFKSDYLLGVLKIDLTSGRLELVASFKVTKTNFVTF